MRILVTGAAGFIGSHLVSKLLQFNYEVVAIDSMDDYYSIELKKLRFEKLTTQKQVRQDSTLQICDINSRQIVDIISDGKFDAVIHLAGQAGVRLGLQHSDKYITNNVSGFVNIAKLVQEYKVPNFLYASSSSVYGDEATIPFSEKELYLLPKSLYGLTKLSNEIFARSILSRTGTRSRGLRFFSVYGPWGRPDMSYFRIASSILFGTEFQKFGDGHIRRDLTFVEDVTDSIILLLRNLSIQKEGFSDIVNIGGGAPKSLNELIALTEALAGKEIRFTLQAANVEDAKITMADFSYLQTITGKSYFVPLREGLRSVLNWMEDAEVSMEIPKWIGTT